MHSLRALILSLAALAMIATGVSAGMARGAMAAERQLCSVTAPGSVILAHDGLPLFDADGQPVTLEQALCLDCLVVAFDLPPAKPGPVALPAIAGVALRPRDLDWSLARAAPGGQARAPPLAI